MVASKERPLAGKRILVPPARPEANPLLHILARHGATTVAFPTLKVAAPDDYGPMDDAIGRLKDFDFVVFSGSNCVINFLRRLEALRLGKAALRALKIVAIGHGAVSALTREGIEIGYIPKLHTAEGVTASLGEISGSMLLLVRVEGASRSLPQRLKRMGAEVAEVPGYRMLVEATAEAAEKAFGEKLDVLALANPTSVRFLSKGAQNVRLHLGEALKGVPIAAVGPATAEAATRHGLVLQVVSRGHIADLAESLIDFFNET